MNLLCWSFAILSIFKLTNCEISNGIPDLSPTIASAPTTTTGAPTTEVSRLKDAEESEVQSSPRKSLRKFLLSKYDREVHPSKNHSKPVVVGVGMALIHIDIDERTSTLNVDAWMRFSWVDEFLTWDPNQYENLSIIHFSEDEIWKPDIFPYNNANPETINPYHKTNLLVDNKGKVLWVPPAHLKAYCKLDLRLWPLDTQVCTLKFGSWTSHANQIDLVLFKNITKIKKLDFYTKDRQWLVTTTSVVRNSVTYVDHPDIYADVTFTFHMERHSQSYKNIIILPCLVIMLMSACSFALPSHSTEKLLLNSVAFVVSVMYLIYFANILPFQSSTVPIIVKYYSNTVVLIGAAILINTSVLNMTRVRKHSYPPKFMRLLFAGPFGKCLCLGHYYHQISPTHERLRSNNELTDMSPESENRPSSTDSRLPNNNDNCAPEFSENDENLLSGNDVMSEWTLVAAGIEKMCLIAYLFAFSIVTYSYS